MEPQNRTTPATEPHSPTSAGALVAWLFVGIPLVWGVAQTFLKALDLFK